MSGTRLCGQDTRAGDPRTVRGLGFVLIGPAAFVDESLRDISDIDVRVLSRSPW